MAEAVVFSLASKILSTIASPAFNMAYEKGVSIWEARDELAKLQVSMETIHAVLLDAEKKQEGSAGVKNWIKRLKGVLYDAEDLFDEVVTEDLVKQQMMEGKEKLSLRKKVHVCCFMLNLIVSRNSIAKKVRAIRTSLDDISRDMAKFEFVRCQEEKPMFNVGRVEDRGCFVDAKSVIGRDEDKKTMLKMLLSKSNSAKSDNPIVLAIVGIGGMGKTTLAQLIYNDEEIENNFENRWFACISDTSDEREVLGKIFQSITGERYSELNVGRLQTKIREFVEDQKYLLVLDDVWEEDRTRWQDRMNLLSSRATESRIIVTTRSPLVAKAVGALRPHNLEGLSEDDSWSLFKSIAFYEEYENDPTRKSLGKEILKKCCGVPLAIRSISSLLYSKSTMTEWEAIEREDLPVLGRKYNDKTMSVLKLSYDHLPPHLKHCFAYCCLFPKDYVFSKRSLINHWIAQGYIDPNDEESSFMHLLRRGFFQEANNWDCGEIESCKMHDLLHDLAIYVAGDESIVSSSTSTYTSSFVRHVSFEISNVDESLDISKLLLNAKSLRSLLLNRCPIRSPKLDQLFASFKLLRTLSLSELGVENIPPSIGELKLMRHLDLSYNDFEELPRSIANLVNLLSLNLERCQNFKKWPLNFHKLTNLRYFNFRECDELRLMPVGIGKMTHLQYMSDFKIEKGSELNASAEFLQQLRGELSIEVWGDPESDVDEDDCNWQLPVSLQKLEIWCYKGVRIPGWGDCGRANKLARLELISCTNVKYLPSLRCLPNLRWLFLWNLTELEFIEEEENVSEFFPCLEKLYLNRLLNLKRWWRRVAMGVTSVEFPRLRELLIIDCPLLEFESFSLCPQVKELTLENTCGMTSSTFCSSFCSFPEESNSISRTKLQLSLGYLEDLTIDKCSTLKSLQLDSPQLKNIEIGYCNELLSIEMVVPQHLQDIIIGACTELKSIELVEAQTPTLSIRCLDISGCPELESLRASARLIAGIQLFHIYGCDKLRLAMPSPTALNLGGCSWSVEVAVVGDIELIEQLSWLPIEDVHIQNCTLPIRFRFTQFKSLRKLCIENVDGLENLQLDASPLLQELSIWSCKRLKSVEVKAPTSLGIFRCPELKDLRIANTNALKEFLIEECPELEELYERQLMTTQPVVREYEPTDSGITVRRKSGEPVS